MATMFGNGITVPKHLYIYTFLVQRVLRFAREDA